MEALSKKLKGSGGGDKRFAQGGVSSPVDMKSVRTAFIDVLKSLAKK
jgi:alanyl-tRNA synthetase